jgi:hypothetical protein
MIMEMYEFRHRVERNKNSRIVKIKSCLAKEKEIISTKNYLLGRVSIKLSTNPKIDF